FNKGTKMTRMTVPPGVHGPKGTRKSSQYGKQLREKQKVKRLYGLMEKQFRKYVTEASKTRGNTGETLLALLETRLDNVVYRLGFVNTRPAARQLVSHRHILVNGKKLNIPSYQVKKGDAITLSKVALAIPVIRVQLENQDTKIPSWLKRKGPVGQIESTPKRADIAEPITEQDIIEF